MTHETLPPGIVSAFAMVALGFAILAIGSHPARLRSLASSWSRPMMRTLWRATLVLAILLGTAAAAAAAWFLTTYPATPPAPALTVERTPERVTRGRYLVQHVVGCTICHGQRDWRYYSGPATPTRAGHASEPFMLRVGTIAAPNITPGGIGDWTDGELLRAMTSGISRDGTALFPLMPYEQYASLAAEDAKAIISYIRTLPASNSRPAPRRLDFPLNVLVRTMPRPATLRSEAPSPADRVAYGRYLVTVASCSHCHTPTEGGEPRPGLAFAGGTEFRLPSGRRQRSANITPDVETGIGSWSEAQFVGRFKHAAETPLDQLRVTDVQQTEMPWRDYGGMTREDLGAIYAYLRTLAPVRHHVPR